MTQYCRVLFAAAAQEAGIGELVEVAGSISVALFSLLLVEEELMAPGVVAARHHLQHALARHAGSAHGMINKMAKTLRIFHSFSSIFFTNACDKKCFVFLKQIL